MRVNLGGTDAGEIHYKYVKRCKFWSKVFHIVSVTYFFHMHSMNLICIQKQPIIERLFGKGYTEGFQRFQKQATKMCEVIFWHVKVCLFWKCIQYTIHWDKAEMLKRFSSDKIISIKNFLFFILQAPTHHSFFF